MIEFKNKETKIVFIKRLRKAEYPPYLIDFLLKKGKVINVSEFQLASIEINRNGELTFGNQERKF